MTSNVFQYKRRVEFCETDAAGIVHFSSLLQYAEQAEHALLRKLGTSVVVPIREGMSAGKSQSWPRVKVDCDFHGSAKFEDELDISLHVARLGTKSVTYAFRIACGANPVASGTATSVCCEIDSASRMVSIEIPPRLKEQLRAYLDS